MSEELKKILDSIQNMDSKFEKSIESVNQRIDEIAARTQGRSTSRTPSPKRKDTGYLRRERISCWADRSDTAHDLSPVREGGWEYHDPRPTSKAEELVLTEETDLLIKESLQKSLGNSQKREIRDHYPIPATVVTQTPKLYDLFTLAESKFTKDSEARAFEKDLVNTQGFLLDAVHPQTSMLESAKSGNLSLTEVEEITKDTLMLLGNASSQISKVGRKRILKVCNSDLSGLVEKEELYADAAPALFRDQFARKMKERAEAVKILHQSQSRHNQPPRKQLFFRGGNPFQPQKRGGYNNQVTSQYNPYRHTTDYQKNQPTRGQKST